MNAGEFMTDRIVNDEWIPDGYVFLKNAIETQESNFVFLIFSL